MPEHINFVDRYAHLAATCARRWRLSSSSANRVRGQIRSLRDDSYARERRLERLQYEVSRDRGRQRCCRARRMSCAPSAPASRTPRSLIELAGSAYEAVYAFEDDAPAAVDLIGQALRVADRPGAHRRQPGRRAGAGRGAGRRMPRIWRTRCAPTATASSTSPERLEEVEERLTLIGNLKRKYGSSIAEIIAYGEKADRRAGAALRR